MVKSFKLIALSKITHVVQVIQVEAGVSWAESPDPPPDQVEQNHSTPVRPEPSLLLL